jgi:hypothetical protein
VLLALALAAGVKTESRFQIGKIRANAKGKQLTQRSFEYPAVFSFIGGRFLPSSATRKRPTRRFFPVEVVVDIFQQNTSKQ